MEPAGPPAPQAGLIVERARSSRNYRQRHRRSSIHSRSKQSERKYCGPTSRQHGPEQYQFPGIRSGTGEHRLGHEWTGRFEWAGRTAMTTGCGLAL